MWRSFFLDNKDVKTSFFWSMNNCKSICWTFKLLLIKFQTEIFVFKYILFAWNLLTYYLGEIFLCLLLYWFTIRPWKRNRNWNRTCVIGYNWESESFLKTLRTGIGIVFFRFFKRFQALLWFKRLILFTSVLKIDSIS